MEHPFAPMLYMMWTVAGFVVTGTLFFAWKWWRK